MPRELSSFELEEEYRRLFRRIPDDHGVEPLPEDSSSERSITADRMLMAEWTIILAVLFVAAALAAMQWMR